MTDLLSKYALKVLRLALALLLALAMVLAMVELLRGELLTFSDFLGLITGSPLLISVLILIGLCLLALLLGKIKRTAGSSTSAARLPESVRRQVQSKYEEVQTLMQKGGPSSYRSAITTMDMLLDHCLKNLGYQGSLGEKLKQTDHLFADIDQVWKAHKYRNKLVHDINYEPLRPEAEENLIYFKAALADLGAL